MGYSLEIHGIFIKMWFIMFPTGNFKLQFESSQS